MCEDTDRTMARPYLDLTTYTDGVAAGWPETDVYRGIVHDVPRLFHADTRQHQEEVLRQRPPLTGTHWDALLAATIEHVARLHGHDLPEWVNEPGRFLAEPWAPADTLGLRRRCLSYAPGAFIRHGTLVDPYDLDARGGEHHEWDAGP